MSALVELASGVDSLYVSGRCDLPAPLLDRLEAAREVAREARGPVPFEFGGYDWELKPSGLHRYRFWLDHPLLALGLSPSEKMPAVYAQIRSEAIHAPIGADGVLSLLAGALANAGVECSWKTSRIDLHADWQHWSLSGDQRHRFVCRARALTT